MQQTVESGKTLLADGPASVTVVCGKAEVFGHQVKEKSRIVIREGKRLPFFALEKTTFAISLGAGASIQEVAGSTIPQSWNQPVQAALTIHKKPVIVLIVGRVDSGKTSFCTYLVNRLINEKCNVAVLDGDIGQSDIGPSGTVAYALTSKPITKLYDLRLRNAFFVGVTSPIRGIAQTIDGVVAMEGEILQRPVDFVVVNTDGWVVGDIAVRTKTALIEELKPDIVVGIQAEDELEPLISNLKEPQVIAIESSASVNQRSPDKRKSLRETTYIRYLKGAKLQCYTISHLKVEPKNSIPKKQEPEKGLLVGLYAHGKFLGVGVLREINWARKALKVQTTVLSKPSRLVIGKIVLDKKLQEVQG